MINAIVTALNTVNINSWPSSQANTIYGNDTVPGLVSLTDPVVQERLWPVMLPTDAPATSGVYQLAGVSNIDIDGYRLGRVDAYVLTLQSAMFDSLRTMTWAFTDEVANYQGMESWELTDAATDYDVKSRRFQGHFELQATTLAAHKEESATLPTAFVHLARSSAEPDGGNTCNIRQTVTDEVAVVIACDMDDVKQYRDQAMGALLGLEAGDDVVSPLEYVGGQRVAISGRYAFWRETYRFDRLVRG